MNAAAKKELYNYDLKTLTETIKSLIYNGLEIEYISDDTHYGLGRLFEVDKFKVDETNMLCLNGIIENFSKRY